MIYRQSELIRAQSGEKGGVNLAATPATMDAWDLTQLAGLHRHLAASSMLTPEYQSLYWQRAEEMLRRAIKLHRGTVNAFVRGKISVPAPKGFLEHIIYDLEPGQGQPKTFGVVEGSIYELTAAMSELGLVLAERSRLEADQKAMLKEAEYWWSKAERVRAGSSSYSRARWAAWQGDLKALKENLGHSRGDARALIFPSFEEAKVDPALAGYINEAWFRQCWYGFHPPLPALAGMD
ncbi:hypothetical protein C4J81_10410 [Deltaproteobacteria bacterium Smac51]|nr:hypothetical protein C4J81_10410 [Deltaproteobacteria bacterium Smac51]